MRAYKQFPTIQVATSNLSKDAQKRLLWFDYYLSHGKNASLTCRYFGISRDTFYLWKKRFNPRQLQSLEFDTKTRRPLRVRIMTTPQDIQRCIYAIRKDDPEKSKYEIQAELKENGIIVGQSSIQKVINRHVELKNTQHRKRIRQHRRFKIARVRAARELREDSLGSLVQVDTKYFSILGDRYYIFSAVDCKSRYGYIYAYTTISSRSAQDSLNG